jgi:hypothetical protein
MTHSPEHDGILGRDAPDDDRSNGPVPAAPRIVGCLAGKDRHGTEATLRRGGANWRRRCAGAIPRRATPGAPPLLVAVLQSSDCELSQTVAGSPDALAPRAHGTSPAPLERAARQGSLPGKGSLKRVAIDYPPARLARAPGEGQG